jgi:hypothetical protein
VTEEKDAQEVITDQIPDPGCPTQMITTVWHPVWTVIKSDERLHQENHQKRRSEADHLLLEVIRCTVRKRKVTGSKGELFKAGDETSAIEQKMQGKPRVIFHPNLIHPSETVAIPNHSPTEGPLMVNLANGIGAILQMI